MYITETLFFVNSCTGYSVFNSFLVAGYVIIHTVMSGSVDGRAPIPPPI
jgi:hypothetical protein